MMETVKKLTIWKKRTKMEKRQLCSMWAQRSELVRETASQVRGESRELPELKRKSSERTRLNNWPNIICWVWGGMRRDSGLKEGKEKYAEAESLFWLHFPPQSSSLSLTSQPRTSWWATPLMGGMEVSPTAKILPSSSAPSLQSGWQPIGQSAFSSHAPQIPPYLSSTGCQLRVSPQHGKLMRHLPTPSPLEQSPLYQGQGGNLLRTWPTVQSIVSKWPCSSQNLSCHFAKIKGWCSGTKSRQWWPDACNRKTSFPQEGDSQKGEAWMLQPKEAWAVGLAVSTQPQLCPNSLQTPPSCFQEPGSVRDSNGKQDSNLQPHQKGVIWFCRQFRNVKLLYFLVYQHHGRCTNTTSPYLFCPYVSGSPLRVSFSLTISSDLHKSGMAKIYFSILKMWKLIFKDVK